MILLNKIKIIHQITENDFIHFNKDIEDIERNLDIEFPKVLYNFYETIGVNSSLFKWVLNILKVNTIGLLEIHIDDQTGDKWGINIKEKNTLYFKPFKEKWIKVKYSIEEFLINEFYRTSCFSLKYSTMCKSTEEEIRNAEKDNLINKIKTKPIDLDIANIMNLKMDFYESSSNDIMGINKGYIYYATNNKSDFNNLISQFGQNWYNPTGMEHVEK